MTLSKAIDSRLEKISTSARSVSDSGRVPNHPQCGNHGSDRRNRHLCGRSGIKRGESHVHLTEFDRGRPVNPVASGRLSPYFDTTTPHISQIAFRQSEGGPDELPQFLRGRVYLLAEAVDTAESIDTPGLRTPGIYRNWLVSPALVAWRIERWDGKVVVRERVARDVREPNPNNSRF